MWPRACDGKSLVEMRPMVWDKWTVPSPNIRTCGVDPSRWLKSPNRSHVTCASVRVNVCVCVLIERTLNTLPQLSSSHLAPPSGPLLRRYPQASDQHVNSFTFGLHHHHHHQVQRLARHKAHRICRDSHPGPGSHGRARRFPGLHFRSGATKR